MQTNDTAHAHERRTTKMKMQKKIKITKMQTDNTVQYMLTHTISHSKYIYIIERNSDHENANKQYSTRA